MSTSGFTTGCNPIKKVEYTYEGSTTTITDLPCPSSYTWKNEDISSSTAGRNENGYMYKSRIQGIVGLELSWDYLTTEEARKVLRAFHVIQYFKVTYLDPMNGTADNNYFVEKEFYVGDMTAPLYSTSNNRWGNISFNIIARGNNS